MHKNGVWCIIKCMRANVKINDELLKEAFQYASTKNRSALIELALKTFIQVREASRKRKEYREQVVELQKQLASSKFRESSFSILKKDRSR